MTPQFSKEVDHVRTAIGLDIGGTKIAGAVVTDGGKLLDLLECQTPTDDDSLATLQVLREIVGSLRRRHPEVEAIGAGAAGMVEWPRGYIRWAPNNSYRELPLRDVLTRDTGLPTVVDNDANVAAWAEAQYGAGSGRTDTIVLTVGTGIGGGIIAGGRLQRGHSGLGGEVGHIIVNPEGRRCGCGNIGCLEAMASGTALGQMAREAAAGSPDGILAVLAGTPERVTGETVSEAARSHDPTARNLFDQLGYWLGIGIASLVTLLEPEIVVIGGGLVKAADLLLPPTRKSFECFVFARTHRELPSIVPASLGIHAGLIGAATLALDTNQRARAAAPSTTRLHDRRMDRSRDSQAPDAGSTVELSSSE
jgi:glucokinase